MWKGLIVYFLFLLFLTVVLQIQECKLFSPQKNTKKDKEIRNCVIISKERVLPPYLQLCRLAQYSKKEILQAFKALIELF